MSARNGERTARRVLAYLRAEGAVLSRDPARGDFALYPANDRRRRPLTRVSAPVVMDMVSEGALAAADTPGCYELTPAGAARYRRSEAHSDERFRAQHDEISARVLMDEDGDMRAARGVDPAAFASRLAKLTSGEGGPFFTAAELAAAQTIRADWETGQAGLVKGSDWQAPPRGKASRGGGVDAARGNAVDARRRLDAAFATLAPPLAKAVRAGCLYEQGFAEMEREQNLPPRSGKLALKLALAQLAAHYRLV
jgi:hypothetical protein